MKRDGALQSMWQYGKEDQKIEGADASPDTTYNVLIVGGGITGIVTGLFLQKAGKKCIIAEAHSLGFGTTGGTSAHINTFFDTTYSQVKTNFGEEEAKLLASAAQESIDLIKENIGSYKIKCDFEERAGYIFCTEEKQHEALENLVESAKEAGVVMDINNDSPFPIPYTKVAIAPGQAQFHPVEYIFELAQAFEAAGGVILTDCRVTGSESGTIIKAETSKGIIQAENLIWATHIPPGVNLLHFRAAPYRSYVIGVTLNDNNYPEALGYDMQDPYHYYRSHKIEGKNYLLAGGEDHKTAHEENTEDPFRNLESYVRKFFDVKEVVFKWSSQYYEPADGLPYIGHLPGNPDNIFVATGFGGNGMMYSHIAALTLTAMLTGTECKYIKLFDPSRVKPIAGFENFVKEAADVVKEFVSGKFNSEKIKGLADMAAGEAKVVKYEGEKIAMYKDEEHKIYAVNPTCTHVKCTVAWNTAEQSWDCPCHGARYSCTGEVLTGPAVKALKSIDLTD